jgi:hypothetical protein
MQVSFIFSETMANFNIVRPLSQNRNAIGGDAVHGVSTSRIILKTAVDLTFSVAIKAQKRGIMFT